jgi:hypothetical protein
LIKMPKAKKRLLMFCLFLFSLALLKLSFCEELASIPAQQPKPQEFAGELFDTKVPIGNYYFVKSALIVFGKDGRRVQDKPEELEAAVWDDLLLSYEAFRRGINVTQEEVEEEITGILSNAGVNFNWKQDPQAFNNWLKEKTGEPVEFFKNQVQHILQLRKLRKQVMEEIEPTVTDREAFAAFLNEGTALSMELLEFQKQSDAEDFYRKAKADARYWENEKQKRPKDFKQFGLVSIAFFVDLWKIPRDVCFKMIRLRQGEFYGPTPIYKGYAVFKFLATRPADKSKYANLKNSYFEKVKALKRYEVTNTWFNDLKNEAHIKVYPAVQGVPSQNKKS